MGISYLIENWSFSNRQSSRLAFVALVQASILRTYHTPFRRALDKIAAVVREKIVSNMDEPEDRLELRAMIEELL